MNYWLKKIRGQIPLPENASSYLTMLDNAWDAYTSNKFSSLTKPQIIAVQNDFIEVLDVCKAFNDQARTNKAGTILIRLSFLLNKGREETEKERQELLKNYALKNVDLCSLI